MRAALYPQHPYRLNTSGTKSSVEGLDRAGVEAQFLKHVKSGNVALAIFGDITAAEAKALMEKHFAAMPEGSAPERVATENKPVLPARVTQTEPKSQAILLVGFPGVDIRDPRQEALNILQRAMSGLSSDIGIEVREKRGLVYYVGSFQQAGVDPGMFVCYAGTRAEVVGEVEGLMSNEIRRVTVDGLRDEEFNRGREQILAGYEMGLQNNADLAQSCALNELYGLGWQYTFDLPKRVNALTRDQVRDAAASILDPARQVVSILMPEETPTEETP
jgi:zinc protease